MRLHSANCNRRHLNVQCVSLLLVRSGKVADDANQSMKTKRTKKKSSASLAPSSLF